MNVSDLRQRLVESIEARREELLAYCVDLVEAPSINPPGETTGPAAIVERFLSQSGLESRTVAKLDEMPNVVASCVGDRPGRDILDCAQIYALVSLDFLEAGRGQGAEVA